MKKELKSALVLVLTLVSFIAHAQKEQLKGLWGVENVAVGKKTMTPVAKWFRINADGTYQSGNGWLQNGSGHWNYDEKNNLYSATDPLDIADEFGGFAVAFDGAKMLWEREEEGMLVTVTLLPIERLPMSPADYLKGIWDLVEITENDQSILNAFDKENNHKLFFRWDRIYINFSPEGTKLRGYWHINGHKSEITLLPYKEGESPESWKIEVNKNELLMTSVSDSSRTIQRKYVRRNTF